MSLQYLVRVPRGYVELQEILHAMALEYFELVAMTQSEIGRETYFTVVFRREFAP